MSRNNNYRLRTCRHQTHVYDRLTMNRQKGHHSAISSLLYHTFFQLSSFRYKCCRYSKHTYHFLHAHRLSNNHRKHQTYYTAFFQTRSEYSISRSLCIQIHRV
ncbi:hypothetical protein HanIR_Chr10g0477311 [Helianthus annuus]|nr:hypothetical protein HanIR_Chr10g0477311 [Helianthus annuus]